METVLVAQHLTKKYSDKVALDDFSISIPKGSIYGLLGPNGAGKTTFIRMLNQITIPDSGTITINGEKLSQNHISKIGYMPEERGLYKNMAIGEQCLYLAKLKGMSNKEAKQKLDFWFEKLHIEKWWKKKLSELSKGMAQKIQFVVTVLHDPDLLIFDEPFSGFDPVNANLIRDEILELKKQGKTIIFSTHRMESVEQLCDYVALIHNAKKVLDGEINSIRNQYKEGKFSVEIEQPNLLIFDKLNLLHTHVLQQDEQLLRFEIKTNPEEESNLIQKLVEIGRIKSYSEIIPTMNEVFIHTVKE